MKILRYVSIAIYLLIVIIPISHANKYSLKIENTDYENTYNEIFSPDGHQFLYEGINKNRVDLIQNAKIIGNDYLDENYNLYLQNSVYSFGDWKYWHLISLSWIELLIEYSWTGYWEVSSPLLSPDGKHFAYVRSEEGGTDLFIDNTQIWKMSTYSIDYLTFIWDSKHIRYTSRDQDGVRLMKDGLPIWRVYKYIDDVVTSWDGKHFAYVATIDSGRKIVIKDGIQIWGESEQVLSPIFSPDSKHFVYLKIDNWSGTIQKDWITLGKSFLAGEVHYNNASRGGSQFNHGYGILYLKFAQNSRDIYLHSSDIEHSMGDDDSDCPRRKSMIIKNWIQQFSWDYYILDFQVSPDSKQFAYLVKDCRYWGGETTKLYSNNILINTNVLSFLYAPKGHDLIYITKWGVTRHWVEIDNASAPTFSPDGKHFAYIKSKEWTKFAVRDGIEIGAEYKELFDIIFSSNLDKIVLKWRKEGKAFFITATFL